jgi:hypothetical protein
MTRALSLVLLLAPSSFAADARRPSLGVPPAALEAALLGAIAEIQAVSPAMVARLNQREPSVVREPLTAAQAANALLFGAAAQDKRALAALREAGLAPATARWAAEAASRLQRMAERDAELADILAKPAEALNERVLAGAYPDAASLQAPSLRQLMSWADAAAAAERQPVEAVQAAAPAAEPRRRSRRALVSVRQAIREARLGEGSVLSVAAAVARGVDGLSAGEVEHLALVLHEAAAGVRVKEGDVREGVLEQLFGHNLSGFPSGPAARPFLAGLAAAALAERPVALSRFDWEKAARLDAPSPEMSALRSSPGLLLANVLVRSPGLADASPLLMPALLNGLWGLRVSLEEARLAAVLTDSQADRLATLRKEARAGAEAYVKALDATLTFSAPALAPGRAAALRAEVSRIEVDPQYLSTPRGLAAAFRERLDAIPLDETRALTLARFPRPRQAPPEPPAPGVTQRKSTWLAVGAGTGTMALLFSAPLLLLGLLPAAAGLLYASRRAAPPDPRGLLPERSQAEIERETALLEDEEARVDRVIAQLESGDRDS